MGESIEQHKERSILVDGIPSEPYLAPSRWLMLALLWLLYVSFGIVYRSIAPLITPMLNDLDMSYSQMGFVLGSWQLTYIAVAIIAGIIIDKWGVRRSLFMGTIIIGLSAALRYFSKGFGTLLPVVALFGVGGPMISIGGPKTISIWFRGKDRGTAIGIYMTGVWIGGMVALAATNRFVMPLTGHSWRLTFVIYGLLTFGTAILWYLLAEEAEPGETTEHLYTRHVFFRLIMVRNIRIVLLAGLLSFAILHGFTNWLPKILESEGFSPTAAGFAASIPLLAGIPAVLVIPRLVTSYRRGQLIAILAILAVLSILALLTLPGFPLLVGLIVFGGSASPLIPVLMLVLMETPEVGSRYMGSAGGIFFCVAEIGGFLGPSIVGYFVDLTGTFLVGACFLALLGLVISAMMFFLKTGTASDFEESG
jgi:cyanate permease